MAKYLLPRFNLALQWFHGESDALKATRQLLREGNLSVNIKDVIKSDFGLFYYKEGILFPVAVHIDTKKNVNRPYYSMRSFTEIEIRARHNDEENIEEWHKVHFVSCKTLTESINQNTEARFKQSQKDDGTFHYTFTMNNQIILQTAQQKLLMCRNCIGKINSEYGYLFKTSITKQTLQKARELQIQKIKHDFRVSGQPNLYPDNWDKISLQIRERDHWICRNEKCPCADSVDFSKPENKEFLWVHHKNMDVTDNTSLNLISLCVSCHSNQPHHNHMKNHPTYKKFIAKYNCGKNNPTTSSTNSNNQDQ